MKLRSQLFIFLLFISILPLIVSSVYLLLSDRKNHTEQVLNHLESVGSIQKSRIQSVYYDYFEKADIIANSFVITRYARKFIDNPSESDSLEIQEVFSYAVNNINDIASLHLYSVDKALLVSSFEKDSMPFPMVSLSVDKLLIKEGLLDFFKTKNGVLGGYLARKIMYQGGHIATLVVGIKLDKLKMAIKDYSGLGKTGETILATKLADGSALFLMPTRFNEQAALELIVPKERTHIPILDAIQDRESTYNNYFDYRDKPILSVSKSLPEAGWGIVVKMDKQEVYELFNQQLINLFIMCLILFFLIVIISSYFSSKLLQPIERLTRLAKNIADGDLSVVANDVGSHEVRLLARSFNTMVEALNNSKKELLASISLLKKNSERFERWKETSFIGLCEIDKTGLVSDANDTFLKIIGTSREKLLNKDLNLFTITPEDYQYIDQLAIQDIENKGFWTPYEKELIDNTGRRVPILIGAASLDKEEFYQVFIIDLSERYHAEARWDIALDGGNVGVWDWNLINGEKFYSRKWSELLGYQPKEFSLSWIHLVHPDDKKYCIEALEGHYSGETPIMNVEHRLRKKDGSYIWVITKAKVSEFTVYFEPARMIGTTEDITDNKNNKQALAEHREMDALMSDVSSQLIRLNLDELRPGVNSVLENIADYLGAEVISILTFNIDDDFLLESYGWRHDQTLLPKVPKNGFDFKDKMPWVYHLLANNTALFNLSDVEEFPSEAQKEKLFINNNEINSLLFIPLVTGDKALGYLYCATCFPKRPWDQVVVSFLLIIAESLAHLLERNKINSDLYRIQKLDAVGQLTGGIAHDFNNILGIILGNLELLQRYETLSETSAKRLDSAIKASKRAAKLTNDLLGFSRRKVSEQSIVNINDQLDEMSTLFNTTLAHAAKLEIKPSKNLWSVELDPDELQDACLNLLINARDACSQDAYICFETTNITIDSSMAKQHAGLLSGDYVLLTVSDNGDGMSPEIQQHIFEPFYTTKPQGQGTGLGLAMVFGFVKRSKGFIEVESIPEKGTEFQLFFPRSNKRPQNSSQLIANTQQLSDEYEGNILVVDDEASLAELAAEYLLQYGYEVTAVTDAEEALSILKSGKQFDLLFSDIMMPGSLNGYQLAEKACQILPGLKVLLTSGYASQKVYTPDQAIFNENILSKPYTQHELQLRVYSMI